MNRKDTIITGVQLQMALACFYLILCAGLFLSFTIGAIQCREVKKTVETVLAELYLINTRLKSDVNEKLENKEPFQRFFKKNGSLSY